MRVLYMVETGAAPGFRLVPEGPTAKGQRPTTVFTLPLRQRDTLPIVIQHIFHFHRYRSDVQNLVAAIDNVAFAGDENIFSLRQKNLFRLARLVGKAEKLKIDGWRWWRSLRNYYRSRDMHRDYRLRNIYLRPEDVSARTLILGVLAGFEPVIAQSRIERTRRAHPRLFSRSSPVNLDSRPVIDGHDLSSHAWGRGFRRCRRIGQEAHHGEHHRQHRQRDGG